MMADAQARIDNERMLNEVNAKREALGNELIARSDPRVAVAEAEAAGFNPVTWLQAGYGTRMSSLSDAFRMMAPEYALSQASQIPQQHSMLSALGSGLSAAGTAMGTQYRADMAYDLNMSKLDMAAEQFMMGLSGRNGLASVRAASSATRVGGLSAASAFGGASGGGSKPDNDAFWPGYEHAPTPMWEAKKPESTNPFPPQWGWTIPPGFANAEAYEDSMGELVSMPYGVWKGANTVMYNVLGYTMPDIYREARAGASDLASILQRAWAGTPSNGGRQSSAAMPYIPAGMPRSIAYPSWATP